MAGSEALRHRVFEAIKASHGTEVASDLMELLPPAGLPELATKQDLALLESRMQTEFAAVRGDLKTGLESVRREMSELMQAQTNQMVRWMFAGIGVMGVLAAVGANALHVLG